MVRLTPNAIVLICQSRLFAESVCRVVGNHAQRLSPAESLERSGSRLNSIIWIVLGFTETVAFGRKFSQEVEHYARQSQYAALAEQVWGNTRLPRVCVSVLRAQQQRPHVVRLSERVRLVSRTAQCSVMTSLPFSIFVRFIRVPVQTAVI